jgi:hypothetical protein
MTRIDLGKVELEHALEMEEDAIEESRALADGEALSK